ncbi:triose-phosphate isomerase [Acidithiobacillus ferrooxidans]|uniref:Triosephosphate isomerase n=4 Tax=Acidithiobacillaceae TaxID=225058 RepID=TPIS_ACIF2|nr:RecName: Full=Triosephosphate isomerase; Short=TIM; Short=TPI; AltName: Full=Triose-phosphate isomerase [Acidithiobacillus ferrooxidans ATCC 23270]MBN6744095.1 triose-phosphate isomerase [Acidithiobacillus sp. MC2.2]MBN6747032.1 triose-phosphate isomerase [Acidithiobacillus sp. PG05]MBU2773660.1 triose-phosphate isomerase [Acidithiobacillus ferrooxidans]MBU2807209.1 triose-phosphate isomerase [Acidithiobacillus ferrooxidans F221]ACK80228.1 triosephosphate isomerase [Acidithiobacillus ferroo
MRPTMVAGNWKMNGLSGDAVHLTQAILHAGLEPMRPEVVIFPPFTLLHAVSQEAKSSALRWGGQNLFWEASGAYTGEISGAMLRDMGCRYVLIGHSERRQIFAESDAQIVQKIKAALLSGLIPVVCVGETEAERAQGLTDAVLRRQLEAVLPLLNLEASQPNLIIAYEPVWAIGTGLSASPEQAQAVHVFIRELAAAYSAQLARRLLLLYGGSVKGNNAAALFDQADIDGALVGGASLQAGEFIQICRAAESAGRGG